MRWYVRTYVYVSFDRMRSSSLGTKNETRATLHATLTKDFLSPPVVDDRTLRNYSPSLDIGAYLPSLLFRARSLDRSIDKCDCSFSLSSKRKLFRIGHRQGSDRWESWLQV